ncbi:PqqD family protein [Pseudarthrobacter sp. NPDC058329]|uniref:PqqD family protein n=1 Tax=Pseudarthrobacter sp. NPDC058329 TaxID=3346448 RepID=UPI0036DB2D45
MNKIEEYDGQYIQSPGAISGPSSDGAVIYSPASGSYYAINEVAMSIWNHLASPATAAHVTNALTAEYDAPEDVLAEDVCATLRYLESVKLVERVSAGGFNATS